MISTRRIRRKQQPKRTNATWPQSRVYYEYDTLEYDTSRAYVSVLTVSEIQTVLANSTQSSITFDIVLFERKRVDNEDIVPTSSSTNKKTRISIPEEKIVRREKPTEVPYEDLDEWAQFFEHDYLLDPIPVPLMRFGKRKTTSNISSVKTFTASSSRKAKRRDLSTMTKKKAGKIVWRGRPVKSSRPILTVKPRRGRVASPDAFDNSEDGEVFEFTDAFEVADAFEVTEAFEVADAFEEEVETPEAVNTTKVAETTEPLTPIITQQVESQNREIAALREHLAYVEKDHALTKRAVDIDRSEIELIRKRVDDIETGRKRHKTD
ncbi:11136_t:CDS:2 [Paraglomus brasilianum]|uniref:11136_t:CDS:1 n=1 Tax=Paraglomus brasilianum TaxID=144538 RepID=A0A9N9FFD3_9GLOM|nr:11136_t:CDS:2 [Paraglomus brasilianum]